MLIKKLCVVLTLFILCSAIKKQSGDDISSIELYSDIQLVKDSKPFDFKDSTAIYQMGDYLVYKRRGRHINSFAKLNKNGNQISEKTILDTVIDYYMIYNKAQNYGYQYDSINVAKPKRFSVDSVLQNNLFKAMPYYPSDLSLVNSLKSNNHSFLIEKRIPNHKSDKSDPDSIYYYYNKEYINAPFTFSRFLDSTRNLKLFKVRFIYNPVKKGPYPIDMPRREFHFELRKAEEAPEIPKLVERFKAMEKTLK